MSTGGVCMNQQVLYARGMNIGGRIEKRLKELDWQRSDLLAKVPDLSPQALSNLIRRDSVRSEWDEVIADALGVTVTWLVYGKEERAIRVGEPGTAPYIPAMTEEEAFLVRAYRAANGEARNALLSMAKVILPSDDGLNERTGTK